MGTTVCQALLILCWAVEFSLQVSGLEILDHEHNLLLLTVSLRHGPFTHMHISPLSDWRTIWKVSFWLVSPCCVLFTHTSYTALTIGPGASCAKSTPPPHTHVCITTKKWLHYSNVQDLMSSVKQPYVHFCTYLPVLGHPLLMLGNNYWCIFK